VSRIIAGSLGGRRIAAPHGAATRPTSDRVREALFARIDSLLDLHGARVLDLYAGSGALGLEAASRGAKEVLLVEVAWAAAQVAGRNIRDLGLTGSVTVVTERVERLLRRGPQGTAGGTAYSLVLADPPYSMGEEELARVLTLLAERAWLAQDPLVVVERSARSPEPSWPAGLHGLEPRTYGDTRLHLGERSQPPAEMLGG